VFFFVYCGDQGVHKGCTYSFRLLVHKEYLETINEILFRISPYVLLGHVFDSGLGGLRMSYWRGREKGFVSSASRHESTHHPSNLG